MSRQIYINLPVKNLAKSIEFFNKLGFTFNPQFTDRNAACMIIGDNIFAMLLVEPFFQTFTRKEIADAARTIEVINALTVGSRAAVDELIAKAIEAGGTEPRDAQDHGWMYTRTFEDIDGHMWEALYMDERQSPKN